MKENASAGQIWEASKAYMSSNTIKRYDAIVDNASVEQLGTYLQIHPVEFSGISNETKADEKLQKYNIMKITPTRRLGEIDNVLEMYLITDEHGHDIGTYQITEKGPVFKLSPKIQEANEKIMDKFPEQSKEILERRFKVDSMETLADKLSKGEDLALSSKEQAQDEIEDEYAERGIAIDNGPDQDPEEKEAIENLPADMRSEVVAMCREQGIKIKEIMVVKDCKDVYREMGDEGNTVSPSGGPVIMVRTGGNGAETKDNVLLFQKGQLIPNTNMDRDRLLELMYQHKGSENLTDLKDTREDDIKQALHEAVLEYEQEMETYSTASFDSEEAREKAIMASRQKLRDSSREALEGYVPDGDGDIAAFAKAIEEEASKGDDEIEQARDNDGMDQPSGDSEYGQDDGDERDRFSESDPFNKNYF